jgi:hypothetical protein
MAECPVLRRTLFYLFRYKEKNNMSKKTVKSGEKTDDSGIYEDGSGGKTTQVKGKTAPPTTKKNQKHKQKVDTNPKN